MKPATVRCKCLHCKKLFVPDYRNRGRQKYCASPECQALRQQANQRRWLGRPENRDYFRGPDNVKRVQQWRAEHPGYWKRRPRQPRRALQEACSEQVAASEELAPKSPPQASAPALQEALRGPNPFVGRADRAIYRRCVTRGHRRLHPKFDSQRAGHSGSTVRKVNERKHCL